MSEKRKKSNSKLKGWTTELLKDLIVAGNPPIVAKLL